MEEIFTEDDRRSMRGMMQLLKVLFDESLLAGFTQTEAMSLVATVLGGFFSSAMDKQDKASGS